MNSNPSVAFGLGLVAFPIILVAFVLLISPFMNWLNGYGFTWIFWSNKKAHHMRFHERRGGGVVEELHTQCFRSLKVSVPSSTRAVPSSINCSGVYSFDKVSTRGSC